MEGWIGIDPMGGSNQIQWRESVEASHRLRKISLLVSSTLSVMGL